MSPPVNRTFGTPAPDTLVKMLIGHSGHSLAAMGARALRDVVLIRDAGRVRSISSFPAAAMSASSTSSARAVVHTMRSRVAMGAAPTMAGFTTRHGWNGSAGCAGARTEPTSEARSKSMAMEVAVATGAVTISSGSVSVRLRSAPSTALATSGATSFLMRPSMVPSSSWISPLSLLHEADTGSSSSFRSIGPKLDLAVTSSTARCRVVALRPRAVVRESEKSLMPTETHPGQWISRMLIFLLIVTSVLGTASVMLLTSIATLFGAPKPTATPPMLKSVKLIGPKVIPLRLPPGMCTLRSSSLTSGSTGAITLRKKLACSSRFAPATGAPARTPSPGATWRS